MEITRTINRALWVIKKQLLAGQGLQRTECGQCAAEN